MFVLGISIIGDVYYRAVHYKIMLIIGCSIRGLSMIGVSIEGDVLNKGCFILGVSILLGI